MTRPQAVETLSRPKAELPKGWPVRLGPPIINLEAVDHGTFPRNDCERERYAGQTKARGHGGLQRWNWAVANLPSYLCDLQPASKHLQSKSTSPNWMAFGSSGSASLNPRTALTRYWGKGA